MKIPTQPLHKLARLRDWAIGLTQLARYWRHRRKSIKILKNVSDLAAWYELVNFTWTADKIDFGNIPWVSVHLKKGDCDDMMRIAEVHYQQKRKAFGWSEGTRCYIRGPGDKWHAVYIFQETSGAWYSFSNQQKLGPFPVRDQAAHAFYRNDTQEVHFERNE